MSHPSEAGHWYSKDGEPRYTVIGKNGRERNSTVKDAREHGWLPSVTSIIRCAAAPGLQAWMQRQVVLAALTHPGLKGTDEDVELILRDSQAQAEKARERGTIIHAEIQRAYDMGKLPITGEYAPHVLGASKAIKEWADVEWVAERSFASPLGYGGKVDLSSPTHICDIKTTDKPLEGLKTWDEHAYQLAAYRHGLCASAESHYRARCAIVYVHVVTGEARVIELHEDELLRGWDCFRALLHFYQAKNRLAA